MKITYVSQPDDTGCGLACVAMICGVSYNQVKSNMVKLGIFKKDNDFWGTSFKDIIRTLNSQNIQTVNRRKFKKWRNIPAKVAIVSTNYEQSGLFHWVVFVRDNDGFYIYDPAKRRKKIRDLRGKMSGYYIEILSY